MVFLFIPNLIGYGRFLLLIPMLFAYRSHPILTVLLYGASQWLDMFDGMAARHFNQCSRFGSLLDMTCDRASNAILLAILASIHPDWSWLFLGDIALDLVSHWIQMYSALASGEHHKQSVTRWWLLKLYYGNKYVLFTLVLGNQMFLISSYLFGFHIGGQTMYLLMVVSFLLFAIKKLMSVIQLISASEKVVEIDQRQRSAEKDSKQKKKQ